MDDSHGEMYSRNWAFVSPSEQETLKGTRVLLGGCGLGSVVATLAVQTGFCDLTLVDDDRVETSNLNRQAFTRRHLGINKAAALREQLQELNPAVQATAHGLRIEPGNAASFVERADIVVNTVDFDEATFALNTAAREQGKPVLFPMNMGWGGFCMVFTPDSARLEDLVGQAPADDATFLTRLIGSAEGLDLPDYLARRLDELPRIVSAADRPAPQLGVAAARSASLVVEGMVRLALGLPVRTAPRPLHFDSWDLWER